MISLNHCGELMNLKYNVKVLLERMAQLFQKSEAIFCSRKVKQKNLLFVCLLKLFKKDCRSSYPFSFIGSTICTGLSCILEDNEAPRNCLFIRAIFSTEIPFGHSASQL